MRIIHCANFSESKKGMVYYAMDRKISNGLIRNNHFVYDFSYRDLAKCSTIFKSKKFGKKNINTLLIEVVTNINPHLLLLGHSELIENNTLKKIKKLKPNIKIAMWFVDWIYNLKNIYERLKIIDTFFITTNPIELNKLNLDEQILNKCNYLPNFCDSSIDTYKAFEQKEHLYDIIYIGRYDKERELLVNFLKGLSNKYKIGIFGLDQLLTGNKYLSTISNSKIGINFSRNNNLSLYSSDRIIHLMANGTLVFTPKIPDMEQIFSQEEIVYFQDLKDLEAKIKWYLEHPNESLKIAKNGWLKVHKNFNENNITNYMLKTIFKG